jgi:hypothetical protein
MPCFLACPDTPPAKSDAKGAQGFLNNTMISKQDHKNEWAVGLKDICCAEPLACVCSGLFACTGCTACYWRKEVLEAAGNGVSDFVCCNGYINICGQDCNSCFPGSPVGLCLEGCCCPILSLSIARLHILIAKELRPDPMDWQIIQCSNTLQCLSCIFDIAAIFNPDLREAQLRAEGIGRR